MAGVGEVPASFNQIADPSKLQSNNGSGQRLAAVDAARLAMYRSDPRVTAALRQLAAHEFELYDYAVKHYEAQWGRPLETC
jgi:hypothetical protein